MRVALNRTMQYGREEEAFLYPSKILLIEDFYDSRQNWLSSKNFVYSFKLCKLP